MRAESAKVVKSGGWIHKLGAEQMVAMTTLAKPAEEKRPVIHWPGEAEKMYLASRAAETRAEVAGSLGVAVESLELLGVGWGADRQEFSAWPMRGLRQQVVGIVRRYRDGAKKTMKWSRVGLFHAEQWLDFGGPVLLPEGGSDVAALLSMGLCGVGRPSNLAGTKELVSLLSGVKRTVIVLAERDQKFERRGTRPWCSETCSGCSWCFPGLFGAIETASFLTRSLGRRIAFRFPPDGAKDVREWVQTHGLDGRRFLAGLKSQ